MTKLPRWPWLDTFLSEKDLDLTTVVVVEGPSGPNHIPLAVVVEHMKLAGTSERKALKTMLVKLDFANAPIAPYLEHLARAIAV